eukprot:g1028.t1
MRQKQASNRHSSRYNPTLLSVKVYSNILVWCARGMPLDEEYGDNTEYFKETYPVIAGVYNASSK